MGRDNHPKARQLRRKEEKAAQRAPYARVLIVCEGSKTEPHYLNEICVHHSLHSANIQVRPSQLGTECKQVVDYAKQLFEKGDKNQGIRPKSFDLVYAVFDRDDHKTYFDALSYAEVLDEKLRNDEKQPVSFKVVASVPSFELWLLLHYESVLAPLHRDDVYERLKAYVPGYNKGATGLFAMTRGNLALATERANALAKTNSAHTEGGPFTCVHLLVHLLQTLRPRS
jgi:RloB-like protein